MKTVVLLRHADVDPFPGPGPAPDEWPLNAAGKRRAKTLTYVAGSAGITAIYQSEAERSQQTVKLLAGQLGLQPKLTPLPEQFAQEVRDGPADVVLVAGHSNTVPKMIVALGAPFPETEISGHDNLFIVTVVEPGKASVVRLKYGIPTP